MGVPNMVDLFAVRVVTLENRRWKTQRNEKP